MSGTPSSLPGNEETSDSPQAKGLIWEVIWYAAHMALATSVTGIPFPRYRMVTCMSEAECRSPGTSGTLSRIRAMPAGTLRPMKATAVGVIRKP